MGGGLLIWSSRRARRGSTPGARTASTQTWLDLLGLLIFAAGIAWAFFAAASSGGTAGPFVALLLASATALVLGRFGASYFRPLVPVAVIVAAAVLMVGSPDVLSSHPLSEPFRYANAKGAFFVQAAIAGAMLARGTGFLSLTLIGTAAALIFGFVPFAAESLTAAGLLVLVLFAALVPPDSIVIRSAILGCGVLFIMVLAVTITLGLSYRPGDRQDLVDRVVDSTLTERRVALWHEALVMMRQHPGTGVGFGGFQRLSPTARSDPDARWAHNSFLQQGAETGAMGLVLLASTFVWGFVRLAATSRPDTFGLLGAVALATLGIHASVDYILHFPAVPMTAAALVGAAMAGSDRQMTLVQRSGQLR